MALITVILAKKESEFEAKFSRDGLGIKQKW